MSMTFGGDKSRSNVNSKNTTSEEKSKRSGSTTDWDRASVG